MDAGLKWIDTSKAELTELAQTIWRYAEVGLREIQSAGAQAAYLDQHGFCTRLGVAGMPSSLVAEYGSGKPIVGFLGEYDALPGLSQKASSKEEPLVVGGAGHGCGHNLLGVGSLAAAVALKEEIDTGRLQGTVRYYGCPAEETVGGKVFMAKAGAFDDLDVAITWHPMAMNTAWSGSTLAMNSVRFAYHGVASHAAGAPHLGISASDAVELLNVGANYLREHVVQEARIHYVTVHGGGEPNVVPPFAEVWYYVRAPHREQVEDIYNRLVRIAQGASLMTGARLEIRFQTGLHEFLPNPVVTRLLDESLRTVGAPRFSAEDREFAAEIEKSFAPGRKEAVLKILKLPGNLAGTSLHEEIAPRDAGRSLSGSTDIAEVSWIVPTGEVKVAASVLGSGSHTWQVTAASGMGIGHKAMIVAAKSMAMTGYRLLSDPILLREARDAFLSDTGGRAYESPLPTGLTRPAEQL